MAQLHHGGLRRHDLTHQVTGARDLELEHEVARFEGQLAQVTAAGANARDQLGVELGVIDEVGGLVVDRSHCALGEVCGGTSFAVRLRVKAKRAKPAECRLTGHSRGAGPVGPRTGAVDMDLLRHLVV